MGLTDIMAQPDPLSSREAVAVVSVHHVPSHSRESSTSSTASAASTCSNHGLSQTAEEELTSSASSSPMPIYSPLSICSSPTANSKIPNHSVELVRDIELEQRLEKTRLELEQSRAECGRLAQIRDDVENEVRELTASLFQEAHVMVNAANVKAAASEKALKEARMQVEVLSAEVEALKTLVLTSTPSQPNAHLHPQLSGSLSSGNIHVNNTPPSVGNGFSHKSSGGGLKMFTRHRRGTSDCDMKYHHIQGGADLNSPLSSSPENPARPATATAADACCVNGSGSHLAGTPDGDGCGEVDPVLYDELEKWRKNPSLEQESSPLMQRLFEEDADRCLDFPQRDLAARVRRAVRDNVIFIEEFATQSTRCALLDTQRPCRYRIKLGDGLDDQWYTISSLCRNRITAVCDILTYLRYIQLGLVKSSLDDIYWEMIRLRKRMTLARLGLS
ncbi:hypothetical protein GHT06_016172 [Daphnia sinensis]|uniref:GDP/GTP exchange factor Sec2 N-terminal domain-containing protein n=1 Tax=Daphnia sinensis TaxID=1820382 RepID=A0AAD5LKF5_9CRUS|nr:hypothetical protein GHT06_016172 [Daphnia sinensis]